LIKKTISIFKTYSFKKAIVKLLVAFAFYLDSNQKYKKVKNFFNRLMNDDNFVYKRYFDIYMLFLVFISVGILLYDIKHKIHPFFEDFDYFYVTGNFLIEYIIRVWVYNDIRRIIIEEYEESSFVGREYSLKKVFKEIIAKKWEYMKTPFAIIDFLAILPGYRPLRIFRIFVIFRLFKLLRYIHSINTFLEVLANKRFELFILLLAVSFVTFIGGAVIYVFEAHENPKITSLFEAIYWSLITISTVGEVNPGALRGSVCKVETFLFVAFHHDSIEGVAEPRMIGHFAVDARCIATSRP